MTRITPPNDNKVNTHKPKWLDIKAVTEASKKASDKVKGMAKEASKKDIKVSSYVCDNCNKTFMAGNKDFIRQETLAKNAGKTCELKCPDCGASLKINTSIEFMKHHSNKQSEYTSVPVNLHKEAASHGTYNTFIDRTIAYQAIQKLAEYAQDKGMTMATAGYLSGFHKKEAGSDTSMINDIECKLEWQYGRRQRGFATAKMNIDVAGKFEMPKVFKVASGMEYPFEDKYIKNLEREPALFSQMPVRKKTDTPTFRPKDPARFRVASKENIKVGDYKKKVEAVMLDKYYIFDNGGETIDRYTLVTQDGAVYGFDEDPFHPQGFGQFSHEMKEGQTIDDLRHTGKEISIDELSDRAKQFVIERITPEKTSSVKLSWDIQQGKVKSEMLAPNQIVVSDGFGNTFFNSYNVTVAKRDPKGKITLDNKYWNYSATTSKYRSKFLAETTQETKKKIDSGEYTLADLNQG
jgi:RNase P subunit RPR2